MKKKKNSRPVTLNELCKYLFMLSIKKKMNSNNFTHQWTYACRKSTLIDSKVSGVSSPC